MFGGLYGDLPAAKDEAKDDAKDGVRTSSEFLNGNLRRPTSMAPPSLRRAAAGGPGGVVASSGAGSIGVQHHRKKIVPKPTPVSDRLPQMRAYQDTGEVAKDLASGFGDGIADEYDPFKPNDYEHVRKQREQDRLLAEAEAEKQERLRELQKLEDEERRRGQVDDSKRDAALHVSGEEAFLRRGRIVRGREGNESAEDGGGSNIKGMSLAQRMMEKMGWKEGQGLGKNQQGIAEPLMVEKTDSKSGKIVVKPKVTMEKPPSNNPTAVHPSNQFPGHGPGHPPSRVLLIRNAVGPGEVDESLDEEIGIECSKYGEVLDVLIFEITEPTGFLPEEAVRIFVQFEETAAATAALSDLKGRYFGGRALWVEYYDEEKFEKRELAPTVV